MQTNEQKLAVLRYMYMPKVLRNILILSSGKGMLVDCSRRHDYPNTYLYHMIMIVTITLPTYQPKKFLLPS